MKTQLVSILLGTLLFGGCTKETNEAFTDTPIIEAYLETGHLANVVVSRQIPFSSGVTYSSDHIDSLDLTITNSSGTYQLVSAGNGSYTNSAIHFSPGETVSLNFQFNGKDVTATTTIPAKPTGFTQSDTEIYIERMDSTSGPPGSGSMPDPIGLTWDNPDGSYFLIIIENTESTLDPIRDFGDNPPPGNRFRKPPTTASGMEVTAREFQYYGTHRVILYHVLPDYASLYDENSTSSQNLSNPSTSIVNGYGIFTGLSSDTLYIEVMEQ